MGLSDKYDENVKGTSGMQFHTWENQNINYVQQQYLEETTLAIFAS